MPACRRYPEQSVPRLGAPVPDPSTAKQCASPANPRKSSSRALGRAHRGCRRAVAQGDLAMMPWKPQPAATRPPSRLVASSAGWAHGWVRRRAQPRCAPAGTRQLVQKRAQASRRAARAVGLQAASAFPWRGQNYRKRYLDQRGRPHRAT
eukprot:scaffold17494_cov103-Isochrysis_galbana.AAC.5